MPTNQELLDAVNAAILAKLTGNAVQSYSIGGRNIQYYSLKDLHALRQQLQAEIGAEQGTTNYASFERPA